MKRTFLRLLVAIATFLIGTASHRVFDRREVATPVPQSEWVRVTPQVQNESPEQPLPNRSEVLFDYEPAEFDARGAYYILGQKPEEFSEFDCFQLTADDNGERGVWGQGVVQTYVDKMYFANYVVSGVVTKRRITLVAKPVFEEDVGYRFEGEFLRHGVLWRAEEDSRCAKRPPQQDKGRRKRSLKRWLSFGLNTWAVERWSIIKCLGRQR